MQSSQATAVTTRSSLLEREDVLAALGGAFSEVKAGRGRVVLVAGEAGVGKTVLVRTFCDGVRRSSRVLEGSCDALATPRPLGAFVDAAHAAGGALSALVDEGGRPHEVFAALRDQLADGHSVVVVEDAHWADEATLDVLRMLGRRIESIPALVIVTYRAEEVEPGHRLGLVLGDLATASGVARLTLEPLSAAAVAEMAAGCEIDAGDLYRLTSGNPFYVREVLEAGGGAMPATVSDAVLARAARVSAEAKQVLEVVSLAPPRVEPWLLEAVCEDTAARVDECLASGILVDLGGDVAFRHELARIAIGNAIGPARSRSLHRRLLVALESAHDAPDLARLAHHAEAAGDGEAVLRFAPAAAMQAAAVGAHREAAAQYSRAIRSAGGLTPARRADLYERLSDALYRTDDQVESIAARTQAIECYREAGDVVAEAAALSRLVSPFCCRGLMDDAKAAGEGAVALLEPFGDSGELAAACGAMALLSLGQNDLDAAIVWGTRAIELARASGDDAVLVDAMISAGVAEFLRDGPGSESTLEDALSLARAGQLDAEIPRALNDLALPAVIHRSHELADRYIEQGLEHCAEHDLDLWSLSLLDLKARSQLNQGRWAAAAEIAALLSHDPHDSPAPRLDGLLILALVRARRGDPGVHQALAEAMAIAHPADEIGWVGPIASAEAEVAWLEGRVERVGEATDVAVALALAQNDPWALGELACWRRRAGISERLKAKVPLPYALELAGRHEAAAAAWRELGCPYEAALVLSLAGKQALIEQAHTELRGLAALPAAAIAARRLRERGVRGVPRGPRPATRENPASLTSRELDVLTLVAEGLSNAQIAQRLFVSRRTVDHHVSQILRKLDVPTRARASVEATRLGIGVPVRERDAI
jgi:DNA-binding CsgD family transcriptional regulator